MRDPVVSLWELLRVDKYTSVDEVKIFLMNLEVYGSNYKLPKIGYPVRVFDYQERRDAAALSASNLAFTLRTLSQEFRQG